MELTTFGRTGLRVSRFFLGAMTFGGAGTVGAAPEECRRMLDRYDDAGGNAIDTAINYRDGESETILGELLRGRRDRFVVSTKYTVSRDRSDPNAAGNHRKNLLASLETSLRRLRTDYLDIYWVHMWDVHTPIEETMRALDDVVRAGKVRYLGISDTPAWVVAQANVLADWRGWTAFAGLQVPYNLVSRDIESELLPMAEHFGLTVTVWSPLAGGLLSGKFSGPGAGSAATRVNPEQISDREREIASVLVDVAQELEVSPAQLAIAWTMTRSPLISPIIGARSVKQLEDNLAASQVAIPSDELHRLNAVSAGRPSFPYEFIRETSPWVFGAADITQRDRGR